MDLNYKFIETMESFCINNLIKIVESISCDEYDDILDSRDDDEFSEKWMEIFNEVKAILKSNPIDALHTQRIENLRERTFKMIFQQSNSSDMAAYLSDDIALLLEAVLCDYDSNWLNGMWIEYSVGRIPRGKVPLIHGKLKQLIETV